LLRARPDGDQAGEREQQFGGVKIQGSIRARKVPEQITLKKHFFNLNLFISIFFTLIQLNSS